MVANVKKKNPTWSDVKGGLSSFDRADLQGLVQDLYAASKDNQAFLHARLNLGQDQLKPYKAMISRWICPDVMSSQDHSIAKAKKAITDYKKAIGRPEGLAELSIFYCEEAFDYVEACGYEDERYYGALIGMFGQALHCVLALPGAERPAYLERLDDVRSRGGNVGWGVKEEFDGFWSDADLDRHSK